MPEHVREDQVPDDKHTIMIVIRCLTWFEWFAGVIRLFGLDVLTNKT